MVGVSPAPPSGTGAGGGPWTCCHTVAEKFQQAVMGNLELAFTNYGRTVARYPAVFIVLCAVICGLCSVGEYIMYKYIPVLVCALY